MAKNAAGFTLFQEDERVVHDALNVRMNEISNAVRGMSTINLSSGGAADYTLLVTDANPDARRRVLGFVSATADRNILIPTNEALRDFIIFNNTLYTLTFKTTASGSVGKSVSSGKRAILFHDGVDVYDITETGATQAINAARVYNSATIPVANTTVVPLTFDSERRDDGTLHSTSSNTSRLTAVVEGWYDIKLNVAFATQSGGVRIARIKLNGTTIIGNMLLTAASTERTVVICATSYYLMAGDYVEAEAYQDSGVSVNIDVLGNYSPEFMMRK